MRYTEHQLGQEVSFLLPSLKLKRPWNPEVGTGETVESVLEGFLRINFGACTAQSGNIYGWWKNEYGEHRQFTVAFADAEKMEELKRFVAKVARILDEESIYFKMGGPAMLISPVK